MRPDTLAFVPRLLSEDQAAHYLGVGKTQFRKRWQERTYPQPVKEGRRLLWDIKMLDRYVDALSGIGANSNSWDDL